MRRLRAPGNYRPYYAVRPAAPRRGRRRARPRARVPRRRVRRARPRRSSVLAHRTRGVRGVPRRERTAGEAQGGIDGSIYPRVHRRHRVRLWRARRDVHPDARVTRGCNLHRGQHAPRELAPRAPRRRQRRDARRSPRGHPAPLRPRVQSQAPAVGERRGQARGRLRERRVVQPVPLHPLAVHRAGDESHRATGHRTQARRAETEGHKHHDVRRVQSGNHPAAHRASRAHPARRSGRAADPGQVHVEG